MKVPFSTVIAAGAVALGLPQAAATIYPDCNNGPLSKTVVCDPNASPPDRAAALVKAMNISEKLVNLVKYAAPWQVMRNLQQGAEIWL